MAKRHDALWKLIGDPRIAVTRQFLSEKLGNDVSDALAEAFFAHMSNDPEGPFLANSPDGAELRVEVTDDDMENLHEIIERYSDELPKLVEEVLDEAEGPAYRSAKKYWREQLAYDRVDTAAFRARLQIRWRGGLELLQILLNVCREVGAEEATRLRRSRARSGKLRKDVLIRLHARACQVALEVACLLEGGFADGAMARWRTLYEIQVVMAVLAAGDDALARRYLDHEHVEAKLAMDRYLQCYEALGYKAPAKVEVRRANAAHDALISKYGKAFRGPYGWASEIGGNRPTNFSDLELAAGRAMMRSHYKLASYSVHAGIKGMTFRLAQMGQQLLLAGASNAGLQEPGQNTAISITQATFLIVDVNRSDLDFVIEMKLLSRLLDDTIAAFMAAGRQLKREERDKLTAVRRRLLLFDYVVLSARGNAPLSRQSAKATAPRRQG